MKDKWKALKSTIQKSSDQFILEKCNEINRYKNGVSKFINNMAKNVHGDNDFVIECILDEYDERRDLTLKY